MGRQKERSELEHLRGTIRSLRSQVKHLQKELKRALRDSDRYEELQEDLKEEAFKEEFVEIKEKCPECNKGHIIRENLGIRILEKCSSCEYSKFKKV